MSDTCIPHHDWFNAFLTTGLCVGLVVSYAPQHYRIISKGSSEGISPWFLLLGCTSTAANLLNMVTLQWRVVRCCPVLSFGSCLEATGGIIQIAIQWSMFTAINVLYMIYYPPHHKYEPVALDTQDSDPTAIASKAPKKSHNWVLSIVLSWIVAIHFVFITLGTIYFLSRYPTSSSPTAKLPPAVQSWATFLGVTSALLAAVQYIPQLVHTYRMKLVGALSIPMMCIQSPGALLMVTSIALRPGTDWTAWATFAVSGLMQASLLTMCIVWTFRQRRLGIDEFGNPLNERLPSYSSTSATHGSYGATDFTDNGIDVPGLVTTEEEDPAMVRFALAGALQSAVEEEVRTGEVAFGRREGGEDGDAGEETPLIAKGGEGETKSWWSRIFG